MELELILKKIFEIRGLRVMLDKHAAELFGVSTKALNLAVKRHLNRFPSDFMIQLTRDEYNSLRFQFETLERGSITNTCHMRLQSMELQCSRAY